MTKLLRQNLPPRERCELCSKQIYTHDIILTCNLNYKSYHAKCLKIENDTALELQNDEQWFCPCCISNILPINILPYETHDGDLCCYSCSKFISPFRHRVTTCLSCKNVCHFTCFSTHSSSPLCTSCYQNKNYRASQPILNDNKADELNKLFGDFVFNPYNDISDDDLDKNMVFNDEMDDSYKTIDIAKNVLNNCKYFDINN